MSSRIQTTARSFTDGCTSRDLKEVFPDVQLIVAIGLHAYVLSSDFVTHGKGFDQFIFAINKAWLKGENINHWQLNGLRSADNYWQKLKALILDAAEDRTHCSNALIF